ncbi:MAG: helix-turn-helix domain-containing protein [Pseudomonadota bacterium]
MKTITKPMTIGQLSKLSGVKVTTIRYYESVDLIDAAPRSEGGQRLYDDEALQRILFIRHARGLGFPMQAIRDLIELQIEPAEDCADVDGIARRQLADVQDRLTRLKALEAELQRMIRCCEGGSVAQCQILATLNDHEHCGHDTYGHLSPPAGFDALNK